MRPSTDQSLRPSFLARSGGSCCTDSSPGLAHNGPERGKARPHGDGQHRCSASPSPPTCGHTRSGGEPVMNRRILLCSALIVLAIAPVAWSGPVEDEIARIGNERTQAFNEGNLDAVIGYFADNAVYISGGSPFRVEGKEAIRAAYGGIFQNFPTRRYVPLHRLIRAYGDTAVTNTYYTLTLVDRAGKATTTHGRLNVTYVKQGGRWLAVDQHGSAM